MNKRLALIGFGFTALVSTAAMAADYGYGTGPDYGGLYLGASAGEVNYDEDGLGSMTPTVALFRVGQQFSPYVAIEGRVGTSVSGGSYIGFHVNPQLLYAGYVKGILPFSPWVSGYAIAGLAGVQYHRNYPAFNSNDAGLSAGLGTEFNLGNGAAIDLEWAHLTNGNNEGFDYTADQFTFGVNWRL